MMRYPIPGSAMITPTQAVSWEVIFVSADIAGDIRLDIRESTPDWSLFTEPKARVQRVHHAVRVHRRESPPRSAGTQRRAAHWPGTPPGHHVRQRLSQNSGPGRAGSPDSKHMRGLRGASVIAISDTGRR